jgi:hypothetical protein
LGEYLGNPDMEAIALSIPSGPRPSLGYDVQKCVSQVVHEWGDAELNALLDYVYFETEPMQAAKRGDRLDFSVVRPLTEQRHVKILLDTKRLSAMRKALTARAVDYEQLRTPSKVSDELLENLKEWDLDNVLNLRTGSCKINPKSLM